MKGPSIDAIRKFKEQQEKKKREEEEKKIQEKLSTLEHRASQGDKKAKSELKRIEKVKEEAKKNPNLDTKIGQASTSQNGRYPKQYAHPNSQQQTVQTKKPAMKLDYFEDLMQMAKKNSNEPKRLDAPPEPRHKKVEKVSRPKPTPEPQYQLADRPINCKKPASWAGPKSTSTNAASKPSLHMTNRNITPQSSSSLVKGGCNLPTRQIPDINRNKLKGPPQTSIKNKIGLADRYHNANPRFKMPPPHIMAKYRSSYQHRDDDEEDEDDYDEEDEYEDDGFVVDEEDDNVQDELRKTIGSIFRYDKRRCDLREQEVERQYRAIGNVSTFEDLEREERRAARLAQAEDAQAFKDEEERKRLKKLRLKR